MSIVYFLHVLGAIAVGFYLLMPFLTARVGKLSASATEGYVNGLFVSNRIGQWILIAQFFTGGYLISQHKYAVWWIIAVIVIFLLAAALAGIMGRVMKRLMEAARTGQDAAKHIQKMQMFSGIISVSVLVLIVLMSFPVFR